MAEGRAGRRGGADRTRGQRRLRNAGAAQTQKTRLHQPIALADVDADAQ